MKIYLSMNKPKDNRAWANSLPMLDGMVLDSEGTDITCDDFVSSFEHHDLSELLKKLASKLRLKGKITIADVDSAVLCRRSYNQEISEVDLNVALFNNQKRKSLLSLTTLESVVPPGLQIETKTYDHQTCRFILVLRRIR
jgi:hypothetical protein